MKRIKESIERWVLIQKKAGINGVLHRVKNARGKEENRNTNKRQKYCPYTNSKKIQITDKVNIERSDNRSI